jgi:hypothetical protein
MSRSFAGAAQLMPVKEEAATVSAMQWNGSNLLLGTTASEITQLLALNEVLAAPTDTDGLDTSSAQLGST